MLSSGRGAWRRSLSGLLLQRWSGGLREVFFNPTHQSMISRRQPVPDSVRTRPRVKGDWGLIFFFVGRELSDVFGGKFMLGVESSSFVF